ncbi:hypothetical protein [Plastoroseomonas hellenica]|uniref:hypothetical protein n=1 Tax=Plastoroseomonas hellenica TaxID=2687306 RepID=UPI001BA87494|nr:hypothetical protein [Plastoroseomonas hellenica]MBR0643990.1 hypothetical protein [Plastoroseomonas hellenica]
MGDLNPLMHRGPLLDAHALLQERLKLFFPTSHFVHQDIPARVTIEMWNTLLRRTPFVGLCWVGITPRPAIGRLFAGSMRWTVYLASRNENSVTARQGPPATDPALFGMVQAGWLALHGLTVPNVGTTAIHSIGNLTADRWTDQAASLVGIDVDIPFEGDDGITAATLAEFLTQGVTWNFDPALEPAPATDLLNVRDP